TNTNNYVSSSLLDKGNYSLKFEILNIGSIFQNNFSLYYSITRNSVLEGHFQCFINGSFFINPNETALCFSPQPNLEIVEDLIFFDFEIDSLNLVDELDESNNDFSVFINTTSNTTINNSNTSNPYILLNYSYMNLTTIEIFAFAHDFESDYLMFNVFHKTPLNNTWILFLSQNTTCYNQYSCEFNFIYELLYGEGNYQIKANAVSNTFESNFSILSFDLEFDNSTYEQNNTEPEDPDPNYDEYEPEMNNSNNTTTNESETENETLLFNNFVNTIFFQNDSENNLSLEGHQERFLSKTRYLTFIQQFSGVLEINGSETDYSLLLTTKEEYVDSGDDSSMLVKSASKAHLRTEDKLFIFFIDELSDDIIKGQHFIGDEVLFSRDNSDLILTKGFEVFDK
ncbi:hypothetical protein KKF63_07630, partial [bacterium]|nr:hypothetical protein [bacterium]